MSSTVLSCVQLVQNVDGFLFVYLGVFFKQINKLHIKYIFINRYISKLKIVMQPETYIKLRHSFPLFYGRAMRIVQDWEWFVLPILRSPSRNSRRKIGIAHTTAFVTPVVEHWLEREIAQWVHPMKDQSDDPLHHEPRLGVVRPPNLTFTKS